MLLIIGCHGARWMCCRLDARGVVDVLLITGCHGAKWMHF